jgi:AAA15 family ATPase/GTPase
MIDRVNINNFRCFKNLEVSDLKSVNLLVGKNSSGKSAFLEGVFLSSSSAAAGAAFQLRAIRRMGNQLINPIDAPAYRGLWNDLFFNFDYTEKVSIKISGIPDSDSRSISIQYIGSSSQELLFGERTAKSNIIQEQATAMPQIEFKWKRHGHKEIVSKPKFTPTGLQIDTSDSAYFPAIWYSPGSGEAPDENAKRFSELDKSGDGKLELVKAALYKEFPFVKGLSIQYHAGIPMMFAEVDKRSHKMPVSLLSDGISRLMGICTSLAYFAGGMVLIDQFEDGFYYELLPSIWNSIYELAIEFKVQLFISTHSKECMDAMLPTMRHHENDFRLLRTFRTNTGCDIKSLSGTYLESALEQEFEVR